MLNFSKSVPTKKQTSWISWGWVHFQLISMFGWTIRLSLLTTAMLYMLMWRMQCQNVLHFKQDFVVCYSCENRKQKSLLLRYDLWVLFSLRNIWCLRIGHIRAHYNNRNTVSVLRSSRRPCGVVLPIVECSCTDQK